MNELKTYRSVINRYLASTNEVKACFNHLQSLIENYPWEVSIAYLFFKIEYAYHLALYYGAVRIHKTNPELTWSIVQGEHLKRESFRKIFNSIFEEKIPDELLVDMEFAEKVRDKVMHGKVAPDADKRKAVGLIIEFAEQFNMIVGKSAGIKPFGGEFRGTVPKNPYDKKASRLILKGLGFGVS